MTFVSPIYPVLCPPQHQGINEYIQPALRAKAVEAPDSVGETGQDIKIKILSKRPLSGLSVTW